MKKIFYIAFISLFLCICLTLSCGMLVFGGSKAGANENLAEKPQAVTNGALNDNYLADLSNFVNDRFYLRQELITLNNLISANVFGVSGESSIILGSDGWLYYGSTLDDYTGLNSMTDREIFAAANNVKLMQQYCEANGIEFTFMVAPNKNSLYAENMPNLGSVNTSVNAKRLHITFDKLGVSYIDIFTEFSGKPTLYYKTDSHWNRKGAALAADLINGRFGVKSNYYSGGFSTIKNGYTGDLYEMVYPSLKGGEDEVLYNGALNYTTLTDSVKPDSFNIKTESKKSGRILIYRDSFGNILYPFIADSYGEAEFSRGTKYDLTKDTDYVVIEIVERNISWLIENLPILESQPVDVTLPGTTGAGTVSVTLSRGADAPKGYDLWTGKLTINTDADSSVFVNCGSAVYEALLTADNGFAVYLPEGTKPQSVGFKSSGIMLNLSAICLDDGTKEPGNSNGGSSLDEIAFNRALGCLNKSVEELYALIGQPQKANYLPSCIGVGEDGTLIYNGFAVTTFKDKNGETVKDVYTN